MTTCMGRMMKPKRLCHIKQDKGYCIGAEVPDQCMQAGALAFTKRPTEQNKGPTEQNKGRR